MAVPLAADPPTPERARAIREAAGWSRRRMAIELGIAESSIVRWEDGLHVPSGRHLLAYMRLLDRLNRETAGAA